MCKTEDRGWSLMDVGVSSVMFASGIGHKLVVTHASAKTKQSFLTDFFAILTNVLNNIVILSAAGRFFLLKAIDYHDHVSEWGVHWNFFLSMAMFNIIQTFFRSSKHALVQGFFIIFTMEFLFQAFDAKTFLWYAPRNDFFSANREGILSLMNYFSIHLIGMGVGRDIYKTLVFDEPAKINKILSTKAGRELSYHYEKKMLVKLTLYAIIFFTCSEISYKVFDAPSRRLCNLTYIFNQLWMLQTCSIVVFLLDRMTLDHSQENYVISTLSNYQLYQFVIANLIMGLINMCFQTLHLSVNASLGILWLYFTIPTGLYVIIMKLGGFRYALGFQMEEKKFKVD